MVSYLLKCVLVHLALVILSALLTAPLTAGPWITPGDLSLRSDIEYLADRGLINAPITTWPIMWSVVRRDIEQALQIENLKRLSDKEQLTLLRLKKALRRAVRTTTAITLKAASDIEVIRGFSNSPRDKAELEISKSSMGDTWAYQLSVQVLDDSLDDSLDDKDVRYDGSYITGIFNNFSVAYGYIDKWWGPGWDSSLILSTNARPSPGIMLQRNYAEPFESGLLSWVGPWTVNVFANELDDERTVKDAKLLGISLTFKPFNSLEIGLRRTIQWGGKQRSESLSSLVDLLLSQESNQRNQLTAIDFRWRLPTDQPSSMYLQFVGEDESTFLPSRNTYLLGFSSDFTVNEVFVKYFVEYSDTTIGFGNQFNIAYNNAIYQTGYRYNGRSIGSTYDNDTKSFVLGTIFNLTKDKHVFIELKDIDLNKDNVNGRHSINSQSKHFQMFSAIYKQSTRFGELKIFLNQYSNIIDEYNRQDNETRLGASWQVIFN